MGFALLVWRNVVYAKKIVFGQTTKSDLPRMGVTLLGCLSILRFEIIKMNFKELVRNKNGLGASCLGRRLWSDSKVINQEWV